MDLISRRVIRKLEGDAKEPDLEPYTNPETEKYHAMVEEIEKQLNFSSLNYHRLDDMLDSVGISPCKLCTYCWNGKE